METVTKTVGMGSIDWVGFKRVLVHAGIYSAAAVSAYILAQLKIMDFGAYQPIVALVLSIVGTFLEKFFSSYDVPMVLPTQE